MIHFTYATEKEIHKFREAHKIHGKYDVFFGMYAREELLKKASHKCQECGKAKNLDVHHIDRNRENNKIDNFLILCESCHRKKHASFKYTLKQSAFTKLKEKVRVKMLALGFKENCSKMIKRMKEQGYIISYSSLNNGLSSIHKPRSEKALKLALEFLENLE